MPVNLWQTSSPTARKSVSTPSCVLESCGPPTLLSALNRKLLHVCSKRPKTVNMEENMDTSPTGPDFYSSPSPPNSQANWRDRDGGESFPVSFSFLFTWVYKHTECTAHGCTTACGDNLQRDEKIFCPGMQIDLIKVNT